MNRIENKIARDTVVAQLEIRKEVLIMCKYDDLLTDQDRNELAVINRALEINKEK